MIKFGIPKPMQEGHVSNAILKKGFNAWLD